MRVDSTLRAAGVSKRYGRKQVLSHVELTVEPGIHGLLGNNGAGKSTLMKILATVLPPTAGSVTFAGLSRPRDDQRIRECLGYLPQKFGLLEHLSAEEFLYYAAVMKGGRPRDDEAYAPLYWLQQVGLADEARDRIRTFSGGMKQRLAIAQALMGRPRLLILDEPTAGLDPDERVRFRSLLQEIGRHATVLLSTHIVSDVEQVASVITIMHGGRLIAHGSPEALAERARGLVYELTLSREDWERDRDRWMRRGERSEGGVVASIRQEDNDVRMRILTTDPPKGAVPVDRPGLEDGYLVYTAYGPGSTR
jgi:ABC-2 type transport system ATP-binding protein